jgi:Fe-S cluster assembly iron-binding protein IscA
MVVPVDGWLLNVTPDAGQAIHDLVADRDRTRGAGVRIARIEELAGKFLLSVVSGPEVGDLVMSAHAARIFLEPATAEALAGKTLDVEVNPQGVALFSLTGPPLGSHL